MPVGDPVATVACDTRMAQSDPAGKVLEHGGVTVFAYPGIAESRR